MASITGVSFMYQSPSLEPYRRVSSCTTTTASAPPSSSSSLPFPDKSHSNSVLRAYYNKGGSRLGLSLVASVIATPNSVLSEEAFKGLGDFDEESVDVSDYDEYDSEGEPGSVPVDGDELAVAKLGLPARLVEILERRGITNLFPIQRAVLVPALEGRDIIARAKTGTGKTLAFGIPIIKRLTEDDEEQRGSQRRSGRLPRVLVLAPTRELARQVEKEIKESATHLSTVCVYGGVPYSAQQNALSRGVDVVVGTPGRIIDLINGKSLKLGEVQFMVLDEADQMLAVGFEEDVELILEQLPAQRQSMLFSATMPGWVKKLARKHLDNPLTIDLVGDKEEKLAEGIKLYAVSANASSKQPILGHLINVYANGGKTIVFTRTKRDASEVSMLLSNNIASEALHGGISQYQRERTLSAFRQGRFNVLVATDVAARGLDVPNVDLVIHYELPNDPEIFVHRSGRTGRAGKEGSAILMFTGNQRRTVMSFERDVGCKFEFVTPPTKDEIAESLESLSSIDRAVASFSSGRGEGNSYGARGGGFRTSRSWGGSDNNDYSSRSSGRSSGRGSGGRGRGRSYGGRGGGARSSRSWDSSDNDGDSFKSSGRSMRKPNNSWSGNSRSSGDDWLIGGRPSSKKKERKKNTMSSCSPSSVLLLLLVIFIFGGSSAEAVEAPLSSAAKEYLQAHNQARAAVGVEPLDWSETLANASSRVVRYQRNKMSCNFANLTNSRYGANQFWAGGGSSTPRMAVDKWVEEKKYYNHGSNTCAPNHTCGVYTQVVWRKSLHLGCAQATCTKDQTTIAICFYDPPGNYVGETPY